MPEHSEHTAETHSRLSAVAEIGDMTAAIASRADSGRRPAIAPTGTPVLDVVIPVYNEETDLEPCIRRLHDHLEEQFPYPFRITIADNASTDGTLRVAERLSREFDDVEVHHLDEKGRGREIGRASCRERV
jgi:cellulose synthase/poly-beta-1,6-N-acetylglucosamine synthase-like glycosyltransferase